MSRTKNIGLNSKDINNLISGLQLLSDNLKKLENDIPREIAEVGLRYLNNEYQNVVDDVSIDNPNGIKRSIRPYEKGCSLIATGKDVVYIEFGTGEKGADDGHPEKMYYGLNPYNSGPIVKTHINKNGRHYWFYKGQYTEGIPSGKQMYNTRRYLEKDVIKTVIKEKVSDVLSKV